MTYSKTKTVDFYSDPGHGWAKVKISELKDLGILTKITAFSYVRGIWAYLEEDCDFWTYIEAMREQRDTDIKTRYRHGNRRSRIRGYQWYPYHVPKVVDAK